MEPTFTIELTQSADGVLSAVPSNPGVPRGDTVIWILNGDLAQQVQGVRRKGSSSVAFKKPPRSNQISGQPFPLGGTEDSFPYVIVDSEGKELPWADGSMGECMKPEDPP